MKKTLLTGLLLFLGLSPSAARAAEETRHYLGIVYPKQRNRPVVFYDEISRERAAEVRKQGEPSCYTVTYRNGRPVKFVKNLRHKKLSEGKILYDANSRPAGIRFTDTP
ncbi:hypothetical protein ACG2K1_11975 [Neisseria sp. 23W00296]|uniref:hypothetical protein n=1 Tax=unclassified Neisseria TaxID=2623750 RepID=UPI00034879A6|nr:MULTISPECIES: hypothetical protein [unclassified Neisseria]ASP16527.1 hypothetical protein CGZ77_01500 [Neisseria sp. KEM232]